MILLTSQKGCHAIKEKFISLQQDGQTQNPKNLIKIEFTPSSSLENVSLFKRVLKSLYLQEDCQNGDQRDLLK